MPPFLVNPSYMRETETDRKKRLAEALRQNLRRRKAQAREEKQNLASSNEAVSRTGDHSANS